MINTSFALPNIIVKNKASSFGTLSSTNTILEIEGYHLVFYRNNDTFIWYNYTANNADFSHGYQASARAIEISNTGETGAFSVYYYKYNNIKTVVMVYLSIAPVLSVYARNGTFNNGYITWGLEKLIFTPSLVGTGGHVPAIISTQNYVYLALYRHTTSDEYINLYRSSKAAFTFTLINSGLIKPAAAGTFSAEISMSQTPFKTDGVVWLSSSYTENQYTLGYWNGTGMALFKFGTKTANVQVYNAHYMLPDYTNNKVMIVYTISNGYGTISYQNFNGTAFSAAVIAATGTSPHLTYLVPNKPPDIRLVYSHSPFNTGYIYYRVFNISSSTWGNENTLISNAPNLVDILGSPYNTTSTFLSVTFNHYRSVIVYYNGLTYLPATSGKLCSDIIDTNKNAQAKLSKLTTITCIGNFDTGALINRTGYTIQNYTNQFMSGWITLSIYMSDNSPVISNEHPLKLVWQKTYEVKNNTNNQVIEYYPNLFIPDHSYVAIALSATEDVSFNSTANVNPQFTVNQYAPTSISFLQYTSNKVGLYAYWNMINTNFAGNNTFTVKTTEFINIPQNIQGFWIGVGIPPAVGGILILITGLILLTVIVLVKGVDEPEKVIALLGVSAILSASAANLIPVEFGIGTMVFIAAYFAAKIYGRIAGGSDA